MVTQSHARITCSGSGRASGTRTGAQDAPSGFVSLFVSDGEARALDDLSRCAPRVLPETLCVSRRASRRHVNRGKGEYVPSGWLVILRRKTTLLRRVCRSGVSPHVMTRQACWRVGSPRRGPLSWNISRVFLGEVGDTRVRRALLSRIHSSNERSCVQCMEYTIDSGANMGRRSRQQSIPLRA